MFRRALFLSVIVTLLSTVAPALAAPKSGPCRFPEWQDRRHPARVHDAVARTIRCAGDRWPVAISTAHYIAHRESGANLWPWARNTYSGTCGVFQHMPRYWESRVRSYLPARWWGYRRWTDSNLVRCTNARANVIVAIRMAHSGGWGPWGG